MTPDRVQRTYLTLLLLQTLAASFIWGVNTLFLLDAGLSITGAFVANAAFTAGMVLFEIPTGVVADAAGRRVSFILGAATLLVTTIGYLGLWYIEAGLVWWIVMSLAIGLGFTFFSGATEAWLVDALAATGYEGPIETVFGRGQTVTGIGMLIGTIGGGFLAQVSFGLPYLVRSAMLVAVIVTAYVAMHDIGYTPISGMSVRDEVKMIVHNSVEHGLKNRPVRLFMLAAPFASGIGIWVFYAFQPYLLELFGDPDAVYLSGVAAALFSVAQIIGGSLVGRIRKFFPTRTSLIATEVALGAVALVVTGVAGWMSVPVGFWIAIPALGAVTLLWAVSGPIQQAYMNEVIPSGQRATVLSFSSLMGSAGGVVAQPALARVADVYSLGVGYIVAGAAYALRLPFILAIRKMDLPADHGELLAER
jgi:MFS family permease